MFEEGQIILEQRYRVIKKLGGGAFGEIYKGKYSLDCTPNRSRLITFCIVEKRKTGEHLAAKVVSFHHMGHTGLK